MNSSIAPIRSTLKKCLVEYVHTQQASGHLPANIPQWEVDELLEPLTERLMTRVLDRMDYYLPIILREEFEDHVRGLMRNL